MAVTINGTGPGNWNSSGYLGVGTASPVQQLHVNSSSTGGIQVTNGTTGATSTDGLWLGVDSSGEAYVYNYENTGTRFYTNATEVGRFTSAGVFYMNSGYGSSAAAYGCRAWVNFNGTGTVAIRASGNVSSITDSAVGSYRVNFTTAMPDTNYAVACTARVIGNGGYALAAVDTALTTSQFAINTRPDPLGADTDAAYVYAEFFR
jgi:hypothetical protein